jgi:iron complex outermembrane receptor protein
LDYGHRSLVFSEVSDSRFSRLEPYGLANLRIGLRRADRRWDVGLWIRNLLDEDYLTLSLARTTGYVVAMLGDPRTIGVTFRGQY